MTSETRVLRPFDQVDALDDFFSAITLLVGDEAVGPDARIILDEERYRHVPVAIKLPFEGPSLTDALISIDEGLGGIGLDADRVSLVVNLYSAFLKISDYPYQRSLSQLAPPGGLIWLTGDGPRWPALRTAHSGCRVEVAAILTSQQQPVIGRPWRRGTWLARSRFQLSCDVDFSGFTARPMDNAQKEDLRLPHGTTRYVALPPTVDPVFDDASPDVIELWVDSELLATMSARPKAPVSAALQTQLFCDVFAVVTAASRTKPGFGDLTWAEMSNSLLGQLIAGLVGRVKSDDETERDTRCERLLNLLKDDHGRFMAYVEEVAGSTAAFMKALGD